MDKYWKMANGAKITWIDTGSSEPIKSVIGGGLMWDADGELSPIDTTEDAENRVIQDR